MIARSLSLASRTLERKTINRARCLSRTSLNELVDSSGEVGACGSPATHWSRIKLASSNTTTRAKRIMAIASLRADRWQLNVEPDLVRHYLSKLDVSL